MTIPEQAGIGRERMKQGQHYARIAAEHCDFDVRMKAMALAAERFDEAALIAAKQAYALREELKRALGRKSA